MSISVVVVGGGYGGVTAAKALDDVADVTLVEPKDTFVHNVAALRGVVDPSWAAQLFMPYSNLLGRGRVVRDRAVEITAGSVTVAGGTVLPADYVIIATGSTYPYPANLDVDDSTAAIEKLHGTREQLLRAEHVLLLGAGPVGLEFAGEIKAAWPDKAVTVVAPSPHLVSGMFTPEFRDELRAQLDKLGVNLLLGAPLRELPGVEIGHTETFTVTTTSGESITADIWFACYGASATGDRLGTALSDAVRPSMQLAVTPELRVVGHQTIFAIGDVTDVPELKMARLAQKHAEVAAANVRTLIEGGDTLVTYQPEEDSIVLPLGPKGGASYAPGMGVLDAGFTSDLKGTLFVELYQDLLNLSSAT